MGLTPQSQPDPAFWRGRRVLVTGHTGFKGAWLVYWLSKMGAYVAGLALAPSTRPSLFDLLELKRRCEHHEGDIRNAALVQRVINEFRPEVVMHLAAQALVRESYHTPVETFASNVMGTVHVLDAIRRMDDTRVAVMVTTDKVYRNREWVWPYREDDPLGGRDPYSASKAASEMAIDCWRQSFFTDSGVAVASARAGNVIGGGDWSPDRLLPDAVTAWLSGRELSVRRPHAVRPWQHVTEPLAGYLVLAQYLWKKPERAGAYNFGPNPDEAASVRAVIELARRVWPEGRVFYGDGSEGPHEAGLLSLDSSRARLDLGLAPRLHLAGSVSLAMHWYKAHAEGAQAAALCDADLQAWESLA